MNASIFKTVKYSPVTKSPAHIMMPWIDLSDTELYKKFKTYSTGINIKSDTNANSTAYSVCSGVVLCVDNYQKILKNVTIQYDNNNIIRYVGLKSTELKPNTAVEKGAVIGNYTSYVKIEHLTLNPPKFSNGQSQAVRPIRVLGTTYYPNNPEDVVTGVLDLDADNIISEYDIIPILHTDYGEG